MFTTLIFNLKTAAENPPIEGEDEEQTNSHALGILWTVFSLIFTILLGIHAWSDGDDGTSYRRIAYAVYVLNLMHYIGMTIAAVGGVLCIRQHIPKEVKYYITVIQGKLVLCF